MIVEIKEHGLMLQDYFSGTSGVMISLYVTPETKRYELIDMLKEEINMIDDHVQYTAEYHGSTYESVEQAINKYCEKSLEWMTEQDNKNDLPFKDMEYTDDDSIENPVFILTIKFIQEFFNE